MVNVFTSWIGEPPKEPREINTKQNDPPMFPDVEGIRRVAKRAVGGNVKFHFCCLARYVKEYHAALPNMEIVAIEDQFETTKDIKYLKKQQGPSSNLSADVDYIIRQFIGYRGNIKINTKYLAMVKDFWSLYCVWKFGGYHIDSGCFPGSGRVVFPECSTLGVMGATDPLGGLKKTFNCDVTTRFGKFPVVLYEHSVGKLSIGGLKITQKNQGPLKVLIDVWAVRGAAEEKATETALRTYVNLWFALQEGGVNNDVVYRESLRNTGISACATGISHNGKLHKDSLIRGRISDKVLEVPSLKKYGFKSHR